MFYTVTTFSRFLCKIFSEKITNVRGAIPVMHTLSGDMPGHPQDSH